MFVLNLESAVAPVVAATVVSLVSLTGALVLRLSPQSVRRTVPYLVALAVGVLLGDAFIHLIPDAIERSGNAPLVGMVTLLAIFGFFLLEKLVRWRHQHPELLDCAPEPFTRMNLVGDAVHNFVDGILIAGSFAVDMHLGITTTLAIIVHEVPQELGDTGALIAGGYAPRQAVRLNFYCALTVLPGVLAALVFEQFAAVSLNWLLPIAAGSFIYIGACDFIPYLHTNTRAVNGWAQSLTFALGIAAMQAIILFENFSHPF